MALQASREGKVAMARATKNVKSVASQINEALGAEEGAATMRRLADALFGGERLEYGDRRLVMEHAAKQISLASYSEEENRAVLAESVDEEIPF